MIAGSDRKSGGGGGGFALTAAAIAHDVGGRLVGDPAVLVGGVAPLDRASERDLSFLGAPKYAAMFTSSAAGVVLISPELAETPGRAPARVVVDRPQEALLTLLPRFHKVPRVEPGVHATAVMGRGARLGRNVAVGPYSIVGDDAVVGDGVVIGPHCVIGAGVEIGAASHLVGSVTVYSGSIIGERVTVHAGSRIGSDGFGYVQRDGEHLKIPHVGRCIIEHDVEIGANTTIDRGSLDDTRVAEGVKLDNLVHVGHNVQIGAHTVIAAQTGISGSSKLGHHVVVGGQVGIADHCTLDDGSIAGAQAGIPTGKIIRKGQTVWGTPARPLDQFKEAYFWFARLPELAERIKKIENREERKKD